METAITVFAAVVKSGVIAAPLLLLVVIFEKSIFLKVLFGLMTLATIEVFFGSLERSGLTHFGFDLAPEPESHLLGLALTMLASYSLFTLLVGWIAPSNQEKE